MARTDRLTKQQEDFVAALISGKTQREAYIEAYPKAANWKETSIDPKASALFKQDKIQKRYNELLEEYKKEVKDKAFYDRDTAIEDLLWLKDKSKENIQKNGVKQAPAQAYLNCIKELCNITDVYPDKTKKLDVSVDAMVENNNPFADLTTEQLLRLAGEDVIEYDQ